MFQTSHKHSWFVRGDVIYGHLSLLNVWMWY